ncbi:alpha/beta hydrolase [Schleiferilactobacillus shenzhenensis]|nr:alpha/beta hydrolase [Schleiferilactobacillus shenzhenensis]
MPLHFQLPTENQTQLAVAVFPAPNARGIVQIIHGALEHKERYYEFADYLSEHGYIAVLSDNRGHGRSISPADPRGVMRSLPQIIADQVRVTRFAKARYPDLPVSLFGHSFGSILARLYLQAHDDEIVSVALTGTANYNPIVPVGLFLGKAFLRFHDETAKSPLLSKISGLTPSDHSWLSYNQENIRRASEDALMMAEYPVRSLETLWQADYQLHQIDRFQFKNPNLAILSVVGVDDKFSGGEKGLADTVATLRKIGYRNVTSEQVPGMKHEVLRETGRERVFARLVAFFDTYQ